MNTSPQTTSRIVKAGMLRVCNDFTPLIAPHGFLRTRKGSRCWRREQDGLVDEIYFYRSGSHYGGTPINNSIDIRVYFSIKTPGDTQSLKVMDSSLLRDSRGYAYHTRFNALSWSTYERCLEDLMRVTRDYGLPWFSAQRAKENMFGVSAA
jgi:hypothetical protein